MKVLKRVPWSYVFTCKGCKSELECEAGDVSYRRWAYFDESGSDYYVSCAVCGDSHKLDYSKLPSDIRKGAEDRYRKDRPDEG